VTLWFDVNDFFKYAQNRSGITGIQRLSFSVYREILKQERADIGFVFRNGDEPDLRIVAWEDVCAAHDLIASKFLAPNVRKPPSDDPPEQNGGAFRKWLSPLPIEVRRPLAEAVQAQSEALRLIGMAGRRLFLEPPAEEVRALTRRARPSPGASLSQTARPGDVLCCLGAPWESRYGSLLHDLKARIGLKFALLVYDLIPVLRREFVNRRFTEIFASFMRAHLPIADHILTISKATSADLEAWSRRDGIDLLAAPRPIPVGADFGAAPHGALPAGLIPGDYVLFVSTIEIRKNHIQAFRIWQRLLEEEPAGRVPALVFAGKFGWMVADFVQALENTDRLGGKLVVLESPDDETLAALYRGCRFTLFPSHYEGWGLPVSESLALGKACIASNRASVPEAGGDFCLYIDPDNTTDAYQTVRGAIVDPSVIHRLEAKIAAEYRPIGWDATAAAVLRELGLSPASDGGPA
jgi:glycosyltransferase involved in cell wall biosynthesis